MSRRCFGCIGCLLLTAVLAPPTGGQEMPESAQQVFQRIERFNGTVEIETSIGRRTVHVLLVNWIVPNLQRIERFSVEGLTLVEVRGGELTATIGDGTATEYEEGSWLRVPEGETLSIQTGNDSVGLQTLSVSFQEEEQ